jgi:hypothetical protein
MAKNAKQTTAAPAAPKAPKVNLDSQLMTATVKARETNENVITTEKVAGAERWFIKKQIKSFEIKDGVATIVATRREFRYRGMEDMATVVPE